MKALRFHGVFVSAAQSSLALLLQESSVFSVQAAAEVKPWTR